MVIDYNTRGSDLRPHSIMMEDGDVVLSPFEGGWLLWFTASVTSNTWNVPVGH